MTDALLNAALAGTSRAAGHVPAPTTPADALVTPAPDLGTERQLLLAAGARAVYRRAGAESRPVAAPQAAPDDAAPICSPGASRLIAAMLAGQQQELLPEALDRLTRAGQRLPHALLPAALEAATRRSDLRPALLAALGERGRWLAGQNHPWRWATARPLAADGALPPDAEALWEEGPPAQRLAILRQVRAHDPAQGRAWLAATWKGEKADFRAEAIQALDSGLSLDDESFLEAALDDRSQAVRPEAAKLLAQLPQSALSKRLRARADSFLAFTPGLLAGGWRAAAKALVSGASGGKLTVTPPETYDKAWARDGIAEKPPQGIGEKAWWLQQFLALIPPSHWSGRFAVDPATLIAVVRLDDWEASTIEGWTSATLLHRDITWASALWQYWAGDKVRSASRQRGAAFLGDITACLPRDEAERLVGHALAAGQVSNDRLFAALRRLPLPWGVAVSHTYLQQLGECVESLRKNQAAHGGFWLHSIHDATAALAPECFDTALGLLQGPALESTFSYWQRTLESAAETIHIRQRLMKEIPL